LVRKTSSVRSKCDGRHAKPQRPLAMRDRDEGDRADTGAQVKLSKESERMVNGWVKSARNARPARNGQSPLFAAHAERWAKTMKTRLSVAVVFFVVGFAPAIPASEGGKVISREQLVEMFENIGKDAKWDMSKPMLWGYFFTDTDKVKLERVVPLLQKQGYRFVEIFLSEKEEADEPDLWWLHVEMIEVHTPNTLDARNRSLYQFASDQKLASYDGMDVGPVELKH
jgi:hypothetical protein